MTQENATNVAKHPRRARALELLLGGRTDREVAVELGVDPSTIWRWRMDPEFRAELADEQRQRFGLIGDRFESLIHRAVDVLEAVMVDPTSPPQLRLRAAEAVLDRGGFTGGANERRLDAEIAAEVDAMVSLMAARAAPEALDALVSALEGKLPEPTKRPEKRPTIKVTLVRESDGGGHEP